MRSPFSYDYPTIIRNYSGVTSWAARYYMDAGFLREWVTHYARKVFYWLANLPVNFRR